MGEFTGFKSPFGEEIVARDITHEKRMRSDATACDRVPFGEGISKEIVS
jgi:hypothetical protein